MVKNIKTAEEKLYFYMGKEKLDAQEKKDFFYQLSQLDWNQTRDDYGDGFNNRLIQRVLKGNVEDRESIAQIIELYNNPYGIYTMEFAEKTVKIYDEDKIRFIRALHLVKDEAINIVYAFRLKKVFIDDNVLEKHIKDIRESKILSQEELETANNFFTMYKTICFT